MVSRGLLAEPLMHAQHDYRMRPPRSFLLLLLDRLRRVGC